MWEFMKPKPPKPLPCQTKPTQDFIKEINRYRLYVLKDLDEKYNRILQELSVTDPDSLSRMTDILSEYRQVESSIEAKVEKMEQMITSFIETYKADGVEDLRLFCDYDSVTKNLSYRIGKKED